MIARTFWMAVAIVCLAAVAAPGWAQAKDVAWAVSQTPAEAYVVVAIRNLQELQTNLKAMVGGREAEEMALVEQIGKNFPEGAMDVGGPLVLVMPSGTRGLHVVGLCPLLDEAKLTGENVEGGVIKICSSPAIYAMKMAPWAVFGDTAESVKAVAAAESRLVLTDAQRKAMGEHLLWAHVNPKALAGAAKSEIQCQEAAAGGPPVPGMAMKILQYLVGLLDQTQAVGAVADVKPSGITAEIEVQLAEGSPLLAAAAAGLPIETYKSGLPATDQMILACWARIDWAKAMPPAKMLVRPLLDILTEGADEAGRKTVEDLWATYEQWGAILGPDVAISMEPAPDGQGLYRMVETFTLKDPAAYRQLMAKQMAASQDLFKVLMGKLGGMPGMPSMKMDADIKEAAETIEGLPVDVMRLRMDMELPPDAPPEAKAQFKSMMEGMFGPEGIVMRMAVVDKTGVFVFGDAATMAKAIKTVRGQGADLATQPQVAAALGRLAKGSCMAGTLSVGNYIYMMMSMVDRMMRQAMPPEVKQQIEAAGLKPLEPPAMADLVTFSGRLDGAALRLGLEVPASEIRGAITAGKAGSERMQRVQQIMVEHQQKMQEKGGQPATAPAPDVAPSSGATPAPGAAPAPSDPKVESKTPPAPRK